LGDRTAQENRRLKGELEKLEQAYEALEHKARVYEEIYEFAPDLCLTADAHDGTIIECNHSVAVASGYTKQELLGSNVLFLYPEYEHERLLRVFEALLEGREIRDIEFAGLRKDGSTFTMSLSVSPVVDEQGRVTAGRGVVRDISERKRAEEARQHLVRELDHRVKNALATVQAIADQTIHASDSLDDFAGRFRGRLASMARIHEAISSNRWEGLELERLVVLAMTPFTGRSNRIRYQGPPTDLPTEAARSLGMVLHELATNAGKYGALSGEEGSVHIDWQVSGQPQAVRVVLRWSETGGPPVVEPSRRGFGRLMIEQAIPFELDGTATLQFLATGVCCRIEFPLIRSGQATTHTVDGG
jgi:two-component system CheB/CheR fusion protein